MKPQSNLAQVRALIKERISHNESYLAQSKAQRAAASTLTYGEKKNDDWLDGEEQAIKDETRFLKTLFLNW